MLETMDAAKELANELEKVLAGQLAVSDVIAHRDAFNSVPDCVFANLLHYGADADIRAKDAAYQEMQDREMTKLIHFLRGAPRLSSLESITFLGESGRNGL